METINQIWGPYLEQLRREGDLKELRYFVQNNRVSPYLELQTESLYESGGSGESFSHLDVNPYVRFFSVFDPLLTPDEVGYGEFNQELSDILLHYLADLDLKLGMCKRDFYLTFLTEDIGRGVYGGLDEWEAFTGLQKHEAAKWLLSFYRTGDGIASLAGAARALLPLCEILIRDGEEIVFHMREKQNREAEQKLRFLIRLFLPPPFPYVIHWTQTYGVLGYGATMPVGDFVLA